jgi:hypothetical protein
MESNRNPVKKRIEQGIILGPLVHMSQLQTKLVVFHFWIFQSRIVCVLS